MTTEKSLQLMTLSEWEDRLKSQVNTVELLGEITTTDEERRQLGASLGRLLQRRSLADVIPLIKTHYPAAFVVFMVAQGVHGYDGGFWPGVEKATGKSLDPNGHRELGQLFEEILTQFNLPFFPGLGRRYVDLILAHGGIPSYSLNDYFANMLRPAVTNDRFAGLSTEDLIDEWLHHTSGRYITDKPVLRFLEHGGQMAHDFVERTRDMAREYLDNGPMAEPDVIGLPQQVVEAFRVWADEGRGFEGLRHSTRDGLKLRKPALILDPWGEGLYFDLLPQQVPATLYQSCFVWQVQTGQDSVEVPVRLRRDGYDLRTVATKVPLDEPVESYEVSFLVDGEIKRTWRFAGIDPSRPLLAFDPGRGTALPWQTTLPARYLWLLYPANAITAYEGKAEPLEEFPPLPWGWAAYKGEAWDLTHATTFELHLSDGQPVSIGLRSDETVLRPHLVGGRPFTNQPASAKTPLYIGSPPSVRIPLVGRAEVAAELARWRVRLSSKWAAQPQSDRSWTLAELRPCLTIKDEGVDLSLSHPSLLNKTPCGSYLLQLRGPLGRDAELPLRLLPELEITGHESRCLPDPKLGPPEITLLVKIAGGASLEAYADERACPIKPEGDGYYRVTVAPDLTTVTLTVITPTIGGGDPVRVPVHVALQRLRWALVGEKDSSNQYEWTGKLIERPLAALSQAQEPALLVDLGSPPSDDDLARPEPAWLTLRLTDSEGNVLQSESLNRPRAGQRQSIWRFPLLAFLNTLRQRQAPFVRFELIYSDPAVTAEVRYLPLLRLSRQIEISQVNGQIQPHYDHLHICLTWREKARLRYRQVRFWSLWQPWRPPFELPIPDEADGEIEFDAPGDQMPMGKYRLEFRVVDPWAAEVTEKPAVDSPNTHTFAMLKPAERLQQIEQILGKQQADLRKIRPQSGQSNGNPLPDDSFALKLERACILTQTGQGIAAHDDMDDCFKSSEEATLPQMLVLANLAQQSDERRLLSLLGLKLFSVKRIQSLWADRQANRLTVQEFEDYLAVLPRPTLLSNAAFEALLVVDDPKVRLLAITQLMERGQPSGVAAIVDQVRRDLLSDTDAAALFRLGLDFSADYLLDRLDDPIIVRLLTILADELGSRSPLVCVGHWVHTLAGWAQIKQIERLADNQLQKQFMKGQTGFRLHLILRPDHEAEPVIMELNDSRSTIEFAADHTRLFRCTKTDHCRFISVDQNLLTGDHNRLVHGGRGASFAPEKKTHFQSVKTPTFQASPPRTQLD